MIGDLPLGGVSFVRAVPLTGEAKQKPPINRDLSGVLFTKIILLSLRVLPFSGNYERAR